MAYGPSGFAPNQVTANYLSGQRSADASQANMQNYQQNILNQQRVAKQDEEASQTKAAQQLYLASQYALQAPQGQTKAFVEQNFPDLVTHAGSKWASATEEDVRSELQGAAAKFGSQAGVAPAIQKEPDVGPLERIVGKDGKPVYATRKEAVGKPAFYQEPTQAGTKAPAGYRFTANGLEPIPGGPADPSVTPKTNPTRVFQQADKLRDEFNAASKDFISVGDSYSTVRAAAQDPTAAGDLSMIFAYMKMLDPNSVVREQEFANAQNAAGVPVQVQNQWNKILRGERLSEPQRADFIKQAEKVYKVRKTRNEGVVNRYTKIAERFGVNPQDVVGDLGVYESQPAAPTTAQAPVNAAPQGQKLTPEQAAALPPGTPFIGMDGQPRVRH